MRIKGLVIFFVLLLSIFSIPNLFCLPSYNPLWKDYNRGIKELDVRCLSVHPKDDNVLFAAADHVLYKTTDYGQLWKEVFGMGGPVEINYLSFNPEKPEEIYVATGGGLFFSDNLGKTWRKIFTGVGKQEEDCLSVKVFNGIIFLGTRKALFLSFNQGKTWQKASSIPEDTQIIDVAIEKDEIYLATSRGVYKKESSAEKWQRIFVSSANEAQEDVNGNGDIEADDTLVQSKINKIAIDPKDTARVFIATAEGILISKDKGRTWENFASAGFLDNEIRDILISKKDGRLYAATKRGAYCFEGNHWQQLYQGLIIDEVNAIKEDSKGQVWLTGKGGIFRLVENKNFSNAGLLRSDADSRGFQSSDNQQKTENFYFENEPSIQELQRKAINYAEVAPEKIKNWRRQAQMKAIMPEVSLDFDRTVTTALGATYDRTAVGPQDWGLNLKWNIGELIWNSDQTSIDSRSKLMVELRDDIINELTRLYFERRRLQIEIVSQPPQSDIEKTEKELRLQELTALIDGLTGGYLSKSLNKNKL